MFNLSAHGDYGLFLLKELARLKEGRYLSLTKLARQYKLPRKYLDHIASQLVMAGLIQSKQGRDGGYRLCRPPSKISAVEVLQVLEGGLAPVHCTHDGQCCPRSVACERKTGWQAVHRELYRLLTQKTLADIIKSAP